MKPWTLLERNSKPRITYRTRNFITSSVSGIENGCVAHIEQQHDHCSLESWTQTSAHALTTSVQFCNHDGLSSGAGGDFMWSLGEFTHTSHLWVYWIVNRFAYLHQSHSLSIIAFTPKHQQRYHYYWLSPPSVGAQTECPFSGIWNRLGFERLEQTNTSSTDNNNSEIMTGCHNASSVRRASHQSFNAHAHIRHKLH